MDRVILELVMKNEVSEKIIILFIEAKSFVISRFIRFLSLLYLFNVANRVFIRDE